MLSENIVLFLFIFSSFFLVFLYTGLRTIWKNTRDVFDVIDPDTAIVSFEDIAQSQKEFTVSIDSFQDDSLCVVVTGGRGTYYYHINNHDIERIYDYMNPYSHNHLRSENILRNEYNTEENTIDSSIFM